VVTAGTAARTGLTVWELRAQRCGGPSSQPMERWLWLRAVHTGAGTGAGARGVDAPSGSRLYKYEL